MIKLDANNDVTTISREGFIKDDTVDRYNILSLRIRTSWKLPLMDEKIETWIYFICYFLFTTRGKCGYIPEQED